MGAERRSASVTTLLDVTEHAMTHVLKFSAFWCLVDHNLACCFMWVLNLVAHNEVERRPRVCENRVLKRIFVSKRDKVIGEWRRLHNEELYALYSSPNIIRVIKSRSFKCAGHVARMSGEMHTGFGGET